MAKLSIVKNILFKICLNIITQHPQIPRRIPGTLLQQRHGSRTRKRPMQVVNNSFSSKISTNQPISIHSMHMMSISIHQSNNIKQSASTKTFLIFTKKWQYKNYIKNIFFTVIFLCYLWNHYHLLYYILLISNHNQPCTSSLQMLSSMVPPRTKKPPILQVVNQSVKYVSKIFLIFSIVSKNDSKQKLQ